MIKACLQYKRADCVIIWVLSYCKTHFNASKLIDALYLKDTRNTVVKESCAGVRIKFDMHNNCSINCHEKQTIIEESNSCFRFPVFQTENVPEKLIIANCVFNFVFLAIAILGNTLVISVVWKSPSLRSPSIVLLCGLATTDLAVGLVVQSLFLAMELMLFLSNSENYNCTLEKTFTIASYTVCGASLLTVTAISLDRLLAIHYHMRYASIVTIPRVIYAITLNWLISGFMASVLLWGSNEIFLVVMTSGVAICLYLSTCAHVKIYLVVRGHQQQIQAQAEAVQGGNGLNMARFKKSAANAFLVHYFLLLCYTPLFITMSLTSRFENNTDFASWNTNHSPKAWKITTTIVLMNSSLNPLIYCWRLREMRLAVKRTLKEILCRN